MRNPPGAACCPASFPEMGIRPSAQALALLEALLLGIGLGLGDEVLDAVGSEGRTNNRDGDVVDAG